MLLKVASFYSKNDGLEGNPPGKVGKRRGEPCLEGEGWRLFFLEKYFRARELTRAIPSVVLECAFGPSQSLIFCEIFVKTVYFCDFIASISITKFTLQILFCFHKKSKFQT